jgi:hypothetical protein
MPTAHDIAELIRKEIIPEKRSLEAIPSLPLPGCSQASVAPAQQI